jgi:predicted nucleotidyltransferase
VRRFIGRYLPRIRRTFEPTEVWVFGSRVRGDALEDSDLDVVVVSPRFEGMAWPDRSVRLLLAARVTDAVELLCYTPAEFREKREEYGIVRAAVEEGRCVYRKPRTARA